MTARGTQSARQGERGRGSLTTLDVLVMGALLAILLVAAARDFPRYEGSSTRTPPAAPAAPTQQPVPPSSS